MNRVRLGFAVLGFTLALLGLAREDTRLGWAAIAALLVSVIARLLLRKRQNAISEADR